MANDVTKLTLEMTPADTTCAVSIQRGKVKETFRVSEDILTSIFADRFCTGYMPVNGDGLVYMEQRQQERVVVLQYGRKENQEITWDTHRVKNKVKVTTPDTFWVWKLKPVKGGWQRHVEQIWVSTGPALGAITPLYDAQWLGNVYRGGRICWGSTRIAPNNVVTLNSLLNLAGDFYDQDFTQHLGGTQKGWEDYTKTNKFRQAGKTTLAECIRVAWGGR